MLVKLRKAGMPLHIAGNIYKIYHAHQRVQASLLAYPSTTKASCSGAPATPKKQKPKETTTPTISEAEMIYHLYKYKAKSWTPEQQLAHMIKVRNRTLGPKTATTVSPYLDVEVSVDNRKFLQLNCDDLNMHRVLQQSTCKHGMRRKVARRALNALGGGVRSLWFP